jgi:C4-dicarboxylate-specific signal transduction histidine kinase
MECAGGDARRDGAAAFLADVLVSSHGGTDHYRPEWRRGLVPDAPQARSRNRELERTRQHEAELARVSRVSLLGELSASLAHELKQPLAAILTNAQAAVRFLNNNPDDLTEVREILHDIADSDRRASEIISRMRVMMKKGDARLESRDLNADIEDVLRLLRSDLVSRNVRTTTILAPDLPAVSGDHVQLQQVMLNLIVNGCDAMQGTPPDQRMLEIATTRNSDGEVCVSIADRGSGISSGMEERIFETFYSTKESGLGMGLAICRAIIQVHGGRLWAENNPGRGATFHFTLMEDRKTET